MSEPSTSKQIEVECNKKKFAHRKAGTPADFTIKVKYESFNVHRDIIVANSDYFKAMLAYDTKENLQGFVDMKDVNPDVVRECIEFMYTGNVDEVSVDIEDIGDVLQAAGIMQLDRITEHIGNFLKNNLNSQNCIQIYNIVDQFNITKLMIYVQTFFERTYKVENLTKLLQLSKSHFTDYIKKQHPNVNVTVWECIIHWIKFDVDDRQKHISELLSILNWDRLPTISLLQRLWDEPILRDSQECKNILCERVFMDDLVFSQNISFNNYFLLKKITENLKFIPNSIKRALNEFRNTNIIELLAKPDFKSIPVSELIYLLSDSAMDDLTGEKWKWLAIKAWVGYGTDREIILPQLLRYICGEQIAKEFISMIQEDSLVIKSMECQKLLFNTYLRSHMFSGNKRHFIAVLYTDGRMRTMDVATKTWENVANVPIPIPNTTIPMSTKIFCFNGKLCLLSDNKLSFLDKNKRWVPKRSMSENLDSSAGVVAVDDSIYVISKKNTSCYDALQDTWNENLPVFEQFYSGQKRKFMAGVLDGSIFVVRSTLDYRDRFGEQRMKTFDVNCKDWSRELHVPDSWHPDSNGEEPITSCIVHEDCIYFFSNSSTVKGYDPEKSEWRDIRSLPGDKSWPLHINGYLFIVQNTGKVWAFKNINKWTEFCDIPKFVSGVEGSHTTVDIVSVCAFTEDFQNKSLHPYKKPRLF